MRKAAPPLLYAMYGNLQTFPSPTALPTMERMKSNLSRSWSVIMIVAIGRTFPPR